MLGFKKKILLTIISFVFLNLNKKCESANPHLRIRKLVQPNIYDIPTDV